VIQRLKVGVSGLTGEPTHETENAFVQEPTQQAGLTAKSGARFVRQAFSDHTPSLCNRFMC
jgi:hypothetical protein